MRLRPAGRVAIVVAAVVTAIGASVLAVPAQADQQPAYHPSRLTHLGAAEQVVVVTSPRWSSTTATLRAYERTGTGWRQVGPDTPAIIGSRGMVLAADRRQGTGTTPAGTFPLVSAFGRLPNPGTGLLYRTIDRDDAWTYDPDHPDTYNMLQIAPVSWRSYGGYVEHLWSYGRQYDYVVVMGYNMPGPITMGADGIRRTTQPADTRAGGGIFLHVSNGRTTAGCVSIPKARMRAVLDWLDPARSPVIVVGPESVITQM